MPPDYSTQTGARPGGYEGRKDSYERTTLQEGGGDAAELIFQKVKSGEALLDGDTYFPSPEDGVCSYDPKKYWEFSGDIELCL